MHLLFQHPRELECCDYGVDGIDVTLKAEEWVAYSVISQRRAVFMVIASDLTSFFPLPPVTHRRKLRSTHCNFGSC
jgi:hypothetical protein